jgi:hypothetical protein
MPLNRVVKPHYIRVQEMARLEIAALQERGEWYCGFTCCSRRFIGWKWSA